MHVLYALNVPLSFIQNVAILPSPLLFTVQSPETTLTLPICSKGVASSVIVIFLASPAPVFLTSI